MKKLFTLIAAMLVAFAVNAAKIDINSATADALRLALDNAPAGDTIVMAAGTYVESAENYIMWKRNNVVMAAEGANVIIKPKVSFRVSAGSRAELIGVKIDASLILSVNNWYDNIFEVNDAVAGNCWVLRNCEVYGSVTKTLLRHASDKTLDSLIVDGCYIHDNPQTIFRMQGTTLKGVIIKNSTFANIANGGSFWSAPIDISKTAADAKVVVDHCTFYHNTTISSSYADVTVGYDGGGNVTSDVTISNCIFAQPESYSSGRAINLVSGGLVTNCLTYNYAKSTDGIQGETTRTACKTGDPLFKDAANADYTLKPGSPALYAATDLHMGDPRWWPSFYVCGEMDGVDPWPLKTNKMSFDEETGYYYKTFEGLAEGNYKFQINVGDWTSQWNKDCIEASRGNIKLYADGSDISIHTSDFDNHTFTIYFDFAAGKVWANTLNPVIKVAGSWNGWTPTQLSYQVSGYYYAHISIAPKATGDYAYEFKLIINNQWIGNEGTMTRQYCENWIFAQDENCKLKADIEGDYIFYYQNGKVSVSYPLITRIAANTNYQSLCTPYDGTLDGAVAYEFVSASASGVVVNSVVNLEAGHSYIIKPNAAGTITLNYTNEGACTMSPIDNLGASAFYGQLLNDYVYSYASAGAWKNVFVLLDDDKFHQVISGGEVTITPTHAYLHIDDEELVPNSAPALRIIEAGNEATNIQNIEGNEAAVKFIQNGQLYIKKNGVVYTAAGVAVK